MCSLGRGGGGGGVPGMAFQAARVCDKTAGESLGVPAVSLFVAPQTGSNPDAMHGAVCAADKICCVTIMYGAAGGMPDVDLGVCLDVPP